MKTSDSIVIIPTYNEKENIENIIRYVFSLEKVFHILIVEDNSPDHTADIVKRLMPECYSIQSLTRCKRRFETGSATNLVCNDRIEQRTG